MDPVTNNFPKMGKTNASARNISAKPSKNTKSVARAGSGVGGALESIMAPSPRHTMERLGNVGMSQTSVAPQEDPAAGANLRNTRMLAPAMKYVDPFYAPISYGV